MTEKQKSEIVKLRAKGMTYGDIADKLDVSINTVKSFYSRLKNPQELHSIEVKENCCKCCGKEISQNPHTREKKFCSYDCRMKWWSTHIEDMNRKAVYSFKCSCCGAGFQAYGNNHRKYCSRDCYFKSRFGGSSNVE